jgi:hypothetical protein
METDEVPEAPAAEAEPEASAAAEERPRNLQGAVYGTILALSVTAVGSEHETDWQVFASVATTALVFWLVHVYAGVLAARLEHGAPFKESIRREGAREWPLVQAAIPVLVPLFLGATDVLGNDAAYWLALFVGVVVLAGFGAQLVHREGGSTAMTVLVALTNVCVGLSFVLLKVLVH